MNSSPILFKKLETLRTDTGPHFLPRADNYINIHQNLYKCLQQIFSIEGQETNHPTALLSVSSKPCEHSNLHLKDQPVEIDGSRWNSKIHKIQDTSRHCAVEKKVNTKLRKGCFFEAVTGANGFDVSSYEFKQLISKNGKACCFTIPSYSNHIA